MAETPNSLYSLLHCCGGSWRVGCVEDRKSTRLNSSHLVISYAVFCLKNKHLTPDALHPGETGAHGLLALRGLIQRQLGGGHGRLPFAADPPHRTAQLHPRVPPPEGFG